MANYSCPNAGPDAWRSCAGGTKFVGCCMRDPCSLGCDPDNIIPSSFNPDIANQVPPLACQAGANFYICPDTSPPFLGCCKKDACSQASGCSRSDLSPATLGDDARAAAFFSPTGAPSATASETSAPARSSSGAATIGAAVGGVVGGALLIALVVFFIWRRRRRNQRERQNDQSTAKHPAASRDQSLSASGFRAPSELSATKSVSMRGSATPPPLYSAFQHQGPVFELENRQREFRKPEEYRSEPVELEGSSAASSPNPKSTRKFTSGALSPFRTRRPAALDLSPGDSPKVSPESATFPQSGSDSRYSRVSSLSPRSPRSPGSDLGRSSPTHPPPIMEDEVMHGTENR